MSLRPYRESLAVAVGAEAKAYGFALVVWTTAALAEHEHGLPSAWSPFAYLGGILVAQTLVVILALGGPRAEWRQRQPWQRAYGAIHVVSVIVAVLTGWGIAVAIDQPAPAFLVSGFGASLLYQLLLAAEIQISRISADEVSADAARPDPDAPSSGQVASGPSSRSNSSRTAW